MPAYAVTANTSTPSAPSTISTASGRRNSARSGSVARCGRDQPSASTPKDTTSTTAPAAANSASGIGRSAGPTMPGASRSTAPSLGAGAAPRTRGRPMANGYYLQLAVPEAVLVRTGGWFGFGTNVTVFVNFSFLLDGQPVLCTTLLPPLTHRFVVRSTRPLKVPAGYCCAGVEGIATVSVWPWLETVPTARPRIAPPNSSR